MTKEELAEKIEEIAWGIVRDHLNDSIDIYAAAENEDVLDLTELTDDDEIYLAVHSKANVILRAVYESFLDS